MLKMKLLIKSKSIFSCESQLYKRVCPPVDPSVTRFFDIEEREYDVDDKRASMTHTRGHQNTHPRTQHTRDRFATICLATGLALYMF